MGDTKETRAIGQRGFLIRGANDELWFRVYSEKADGEAFVDYEITNYDCEVVIIDPHAAFIRNEAGDFLDYTTESMQIAS
jgi:hypothetical protein